MPTLQEKQAKLSNLELLLRKYQQLEMQTMAEIRVLREEVARETPEADITTVRETMETVPIAEPIEEPA